MRRTYASFAETVLALLERVADLWAQAFFCLVALPALNPKGLRTKAEVDAAERHLFLSEAHLARAIYRTARRLAGLSRIPCPIEAFFLPPLKTARHIRWRYLNHSYNLRHARRLALRMAWRWKQESERRARDPFCRLRGDLSPTAATFLPLSRSDWGRWIARSCAQDGGGSPTGTLSAGQRARAPP